MLKIISGAAGTGKSAKLYEMIAEAAGQGEKVVLFVPDQFSFEAEKIVYKRVKHSALANVRVTMFSREAETLLRKFGETKEYADDIAKKILMSRAVKEALKESGLRYYGRQAEKPDFADFALEIVGELRTAGVTPSKFRSAVAEENDFSETLTNKVNDISIIYSRYDELLTQLYSDRTDDIRRAAELIRENGVYDGVTCFFDGFDHFSGNQSDFINAVIEKAHGAVFTITTDHSRPDDRCFKAANKLIGRLKAAADGNAKEIKLTEAHRKRSSFSVVCAQDMWQECDYICAKIRRLTDEGMRYREIAVLSPRDDYSQIMRSAMKKYGIPSFTDIPEPLISKSFVKFPIFALRALSFESEDILRYLKSGYVRVGEDKKLIRNADIDKLEQLCRKYDLRKRDWLHEFPDKLSDGDELEKLRVSIITPLRQLKRDLVGKDGAEKTRVICEFMFDVMNINSTIYGKCILNENDGKKILSKKLDDYSSLLDEAITVFESLHKSLARHFASIKDYLAIMTDIFTVTTTARPPQVIDAVTVGDIERSRFNKVRAVFVCGFGSGVIPRPSDYSAVFTASEGEKLSEIGIAIGDDRQTRFSAEAFSVYRCLNLPEELLCVTYPKLDSSFNFADPSPALVEYVENCRKNGETVEKIDANALDADFYCRTEEAAKSYLSGMYSDFSRSSETAALAARLPEGFTSMLREASESGQPEKLRRLISKEHAGALLLSDTYSPTRLEKLNDCRFNYFCRYGLGIKPPEDRQVDPLLVGNVIHFCLCELLTAYLGNPNGFMALTPREIYRHISKSAIKYEEKNYFDGFGSSERFSYMLKRLSYTAFRAAMRIQEEMTAGGFFPEMLEKELDFPFGSITIKGTCDRIDSVNSNGQKYFRVVDYKHGDKEMHLKDAFSGSSLQMLLYLFGACQTYQTAPASVMYSLVGGIKNSKTDGDDGETQTKKSVTAYVKSHCMRGILIDSSPENNEVNTINTNLKSKYGDADYISAERITAAQYKALEQYCLAYVNAIVTEAANGMVSSNCKNERKCGYCDYRLICGRKEADEE